MTAPTAASLQPHLDAPVQGLVIRPLRRDDGDLLDEVMAAMSSRSRYQRFHSSKPRLTAAERAYFTNVDGSHHVAVLALAPHGEPLGVAHAIRIQRGSAVAEVAVAIVDARQRQGIGTDLIGSLARRAVGVGIERLVANVLAETGLARVLASRGWRVTGRDGHVVTLEVAAWQAAAR